MKKGSKKSVTSAFMVIRAVALMAATSSLVMATDLIVKVKGIQSTKGMIECSLFAGSQGFPMDNAPAKTLTATPNPEGVSIRFPNVSPGTYAVSVAHDLNGNHKVDTNFLGIPTEPWGVSRNLRPTLRAPKFEEAAFQVVEGQDITIEITVAK